MPQVSFAFGKSLLFHGGDTGSIPVRDANSSDQIIYSMFYRFNLERNLTPLNVFTQAAGCH